MPLDPSAVVFVLRDDESELELELVSVRRSLVEWEDGALSSRLVMDGRADNLLELLIFGDFAWIFGEDG